MPEEIIPSSPLWYGILGYFLRILCFICGLGSSIWVSSCFPQLPVELAFELGYSGNPSIFACWSLNLSFLGCLDETHASKALLCFSSLILLSCSTAFICARELWGLVIRILSYYIHLLRVTTDNKAVPWTLLLVPLPPLSYHQKLLKNLSCKQLGKGVSI